MNTRPTLGNVSRGIGAAALLFSQSAQSDEALLQQGTSLGQFPASSLSSLQNTFATQLVSDITPDPSLLPSTSFRWLLVKTDSGLALTLPENYSGNIMHFGQQEKFFVRFDLSTGLPEISFDLKNWQPYTAGTPVNISREEQATLLDISANLQTLNTLQTEQQTLATTLAVKKNELTQVQDEIDQLQTDYIVSLSDLATTNSTLTNKETTKSSLESSIGREARLRTDTHPVAANTTLDDAVKNTSIQSALNTYDNTPSTIQSMQVQSFSLQSNTLQTDTLLSATFATNTPQITATSTIPTAADVQSTITVLTSELSRIQTQINTVNSQITAKQNEINTTQNTINSIQQTIDTLNIQINEYSSAYTYWDTEWKRLKAKADGIHADIQDTIGYYDGTRQTLMIEGGRNDVPGVGDLEDSDIAAQIDALKSRIGRELIALTNSVPTHTYTDTTTKNLSTIKKSFVRVGGEYRYNITFSSTGGYPATIKMYTKFIGDFSEALFKTYTAYNTTHRDAIVNQTILPLGNKACDYALADRRLETYQEQYSQLVIDWDIAVGDQLYASIDRSEAKNNLYDALELVAQKDQEVAALNAQKSTLTTQKSELETLKNTKATLQSLYTRVKTILDQLQQHVASHGTITQQIGDLIQQAHQLESDLATLDILLEYAEGDETALANTVGSLSDTLTSVNNSLSQNEQQLLAILNTIQNIIPQDTFNRNGTQLTPASDGVKNFFGDGYRTGYFSGSLSGLPAKWITQYEWTKGINDIYPAYGSVQYIVNGRTYRTDAQRMNNFNHKELVNGYNADAITKLNACIAFFNQYPAGSNEGIEALFSAIKAQIAKLEASKSTNTTIKNHVTLVNDFTKKTLLQGGSYALFEQLVAKNPAFASRIESITATAVQKGNIPAGTDAIIDMRHMITTMMAREFAARLMSTGTDGLDLYAQWEQESLSFINGLGDVSDKVDMNADWSIDDHGNKYKFGLYHPAGIGNYTVPATLFMLYSPDGSNTQVLGPVSVASGEEAETMKARWRQELLKMKRSHTTYSGGTYDIFRGFDEKGEYVFWGKYATRPGGTLLGTGFSGTTTGTEGVMKNNILNSKIRSSIGLRVMLPRGMDDIRKAEQYLLSLQSKYVYQISGISSKNGMKIDIESLDTLAEINSIRLGIISKIETPGFVGVLPQADADYVFNLRNRLIAGISRDFAEQGGYWHIQPGTDSFAALRVLMVEFLGTLMQTASQSAYQDNLMIIPLLSQEKGDSLHAMFQEQYTTFGDNTRLLTQEILDAAYGDDFYYLATGNPPVGYDIMYYASFFLPGPSEGAFALKTPSLVRLAVKKGSQLEKHLFKEVAPGIVRQVAEDGKITEIVNGLARRASPEVDAMESVFHSRIGTFAQSDINTILSKDPAVVADEIYKIARDKEGRMVFLNKGTVATAEKGGYGFDHVIKEIKSGNITRYEELKNGGQILNGEDIEDVIDKIVSNYDRFVIEGGKIKYFKIVNGKELTLSTDSISGKIITLTY